MTARGGRPVAETDMKWDFFISYTQTDRSWAEWIAWILEEHGYRVVVQAWDFVPGSNWTQSMQDGATQSRTTIAVLSQNYLSSAYGTAEWLTARMRDPDGRAGALLPIRVEDCPRPGFLGDIVGIDIFGATEADAKTRIRDAASTIGGKRAKPSIKPNFPGAGRAITQPARFPGAMPTTWQVPGRNPNFTGRGDELDQLHRDLVAGSRVTVHSIQGLGGVGKTQLATEYAYRYAGDYDAIWWITSEEAATIPDQFAALGKRFGIESTEGPDDLRIRVHEALRSVEGWLLVFDNADAVDDIKQWLPTAPMPSGMPGHVIVTTRRTGFRTLGPVLDLDVLDLDAAVRLLQARVPDLDTPTATTIATTLGQLPLALEQAAAYLDRTQIPASEYLNLLESDFDIMATGSLDKSVRQSVHNVWTLSLDRIGNDDPAALQLLDICAYLAPESIPLDLFSTHPDQLPTPLADVVVDPIKFTDTIATVVGYSMAKRIPTGLQLHRLVQAALRARHPHPT